MSVVARGYLFHRKSNIEMIMLKKRKPGFFIVGAPKCGTTALSEYLRAHPQIFISDPKEPFFFCTDFPEERRHFKSVDEYEALFSDVSENVVAVGEASTWYLASSVAVRELVSYQPDAKIIIMLRNPVDMAFSLHSQNIVVQDEDCLDFERAWMLRDERRCGRELPATCGNPKFLQYGDICSLGQQLERVMKIVPKRNMLCIVYDDFSSDTRGIYKNVLDFLGVEDDGRTDFARINASRGYKLSLVHKVMFSSSVYSRLQKAKSWLGIKRGLGIYSTVENFNIIERERKPMSEDLAFELKQYFREDVKLLSSLLGRDLTHWVS